MGLAAPNGIGVRVVAQSDLDAFMQQVIARRDDNWKKLQQYVLDERNEIDVRGPGGSRIWGERREYAWFIRDGFFIRSPLSVNGVRIGESDRLKYEADYLRRVQRADRRLAVGAGGADAGGADDAAAKGTREADAGNAAKGPVSPESTAPADIDAFLRQSRQPEFISSAYFLRFKFDQGRYALVGRESLEGRDVLRIEYYPTKLFVGRETGDGQNEDEDEGRRRSRRRARSQAAEDQMLRLLNKVALVTLWIEPASHQIVKYTFDNVSFDFLPAVWLVRADSLTASMTMWQPFPEVWLPRLLTMNGAATLAAGTFELHWTTEYHDYREADVAVKVGIPGADSQKKR
jgi:hypothetical protein